MSLEVCGECGARFAVGLLRCPQCGATAPLFADLMVEEGPVAKITVGGGVSNADAQPGEPGYIEPEAGEDVSPGISSSTSGNKPGKSSTTMPTGPRSPAPTTENPSSPDPAPRLGSGGADSTDGSIRGTGSDPSPRGGSSTGSPKDPGPTAVPRSRRKAT